MWIVRSTFCLSCPYKRASSGSGAALKSWIPAFAGMTALLDALGLGVLPEGFHFIERSCGGAGTAGRQHGLDMVEAACKLRVGGAQGGLRIHLQVPSQVGDHDEQVAEFLIALRLGLCFGVLV